MGHLECYILNITKRKTMQHTGYTSYIIDHNLKASEFLRLCLRAFNIFIEYRDEPLSPIIPKELPKDDYHEKELVKAKEKLAQRLAMTDDEWRKELENDLADKIVKHKEAVEQENAEMARLNAVKEAIEGWKCSEAYDRVKNFALEQIAKSEPYGYKWYTESEECLRKALENQEEFEKYKAELIQCYREDVAYHEKGAAENEASWKKANEFLAGFWKEIELLEKEGK